MYSSNFVEFAPTTIHEKKFAYVESNKNFMLVDHENNALCNIKFPLFVLRILKSCLFCLPMLVDSCSHKLFAHKIPMHRKWVRLKCASHILHDALFVFQIISFVWASLKSSCLARKTLKKSACWETTQHLPYCFCVLTWLSYCSNNSL